MKAKPRLLSVSLAAVLSVSLLASQPASALTVFDPSNFVQNTLTAVRTLEQINNQINQLQNEAQMLMNQARNLANLDFNIVNRLRSTLATTERLIAEAQGLAYDVTNMDREFARLYPKQYAATGALQAMQATNQLLALQAKQSIQAQQLQITQDRAASLELARQAAATERAREVRRRFLGSGTPYTPQSVNFYNN